MENGSNNECAADGIVARMNARLSVPAGPWKIMTVSKITAKQQLQWQLEQHLQWQLGTVAMTAGTVFTALAVNSALSHILPLILLLCYIC